MAAGVDALRTKRGAATLGRCVCLQVGGAGRRGGARGGSGWGVWCGSSGLEGWPFRAPHRAWEVVRSSAGGGEG